MNSSTLGINDFLNDLLEMKDKINNPNGFDKTIVRLDNFRPGKIIVCKTLIRGAQPVPVLEMIFHEGQNRLSLDPNFIGVVVGSSKNEAKKYHFEYVGYSKEEIEDFKKKEELVNRK